MRVIKVATDDGNAYYDIVSRLKETHLRFQSVSPGEGVDQPRDLVITSSKEVGLFGGDAVAIEDLDENPVIMEGQLLSRLLDRSNGDMLVGIDPGSRIGLAMFYGGRGFGSLTTNSVEETVALVVRSADAVPHSSFCVRIGGGEPRSSKRLATMLRKKLSKATSIEIVDERGTSSGKRGPAAATKDQRAAARIAYRKGVEFTDPAEPRRNPLPQS